MNIIKQLDKVVSFDAKESGTERNDYYGAWNGLIRPILKWNHEEVNP